MVYTFKKNIKEVLYLQIANNQSITIKKPNGINILNPQFVEALEGANNAEFNS